MTLTQFKVAIEAGNCRSDPEEDIFFFFSDWFINKSLVLESRAMKNQKEEKPVTTQRKITQTAEAGGALFDQNKYIVQPWCLSEFFCISSACWHLTMWLCTHRICKSKVFRHMHEWHGMIS